MALLADEVDGVFEFPPKTSAMPDALPDSDFVETVLRRENNLIFVLRNIDRLLAPKQLSND
jgi:chemotaxis signal transduction protein